MAADLSPGMIIGGRYRLDRPLGEGGMGLVWAAEHVETGRPVALKLVKHASADPETRRRVLREAHAASLVHHPNVVAIDEVIAHEDGSPVIVMELLHGEPLAARLRRERQMSLADVATIFVQVVSAVGAAHALGVIHRDLKPENVLLARGEGGAVTVKVLDFGIAKLLALDEETARSSGLTTSSLIGTPAYMAPEQVFGERDIDGRADVWALGIVIYQALSGVLPTAGQNVGQVFKNVLARPFPPLASLVPDLPEDVLDLVGRMMTRERAQRPSSLHEAMDVLAKWTDVEAPSFGAPAHVSERSEADDHPIAIDVGRGSAFAGRPIEPGPTLKLAETLPPSVPARRASPRGRGAKTTAAIALAVVAITTSAIAWRGLRSPPPPAPAPPVSPLAVPDAVIACPIFKASGVDEPSGWLGAAAASTACERARVILGGRSDRTLVPAELIGLPKLPIDGFPLDPFAAPDARARSIDAAKLRAGAYVDGEVSKRSAGFYVAIALRRASGEALARGAGEGRGLYEAVRRAMDPIVEAGALPRAASLDPSIAEWSRARDVGGALALVDLTLAIAHNAGSLPDECARVEAARASLPDLAPFARWLCAYTLGLPAPVDAALLPDPSSPGALAARARVEHMVNRRDDPKAIEALRAAFDRERSGYGRSLLAATESCLLQASDARRAYETALRAVQSDPKNPDGHFCSPWSQLVAVTTDTASAEGTVRAMQAWVPWDGNGWMMQAASPRGDRDVQLRAARRAYTLTPFDAAVADVLVSKLLERGAREEARAVALALVAGGQPVHRVESELILVRMDASEARFGAALERARRALVVSASDAGWVRVQRIEIAWRALEIALILDRAPALADLVVERFLDPDPPPLDGVYLSVPMRLAAICALATRPTSRRCFARLRALRDRLSGGILPSTQAFTEGAERYAQGNLAGAAAAWRPLMREPGMFAEALPDAMATAFDRAGDVELAGRIDAMLGARAAELNGATIAHVRAARRALARGDKSRARTEAQRVIDAWSVADETVPAVEEMRRLIAGLR